MTTMAVCESGLVGFFHASGGDQNLELSGLANGVSVAVNQHNRRSAMEPPLTVWKLISFLVGAAVLVLGSVLTLLIFFHDLSRDDVKRFEGLVTSMDARMGAMDRKIDVVIRDISGIRLQLNNLEHKHDRSLGLE